MERGLLLIVLRIYLGAPCEQVSGCFRLQTLARPVERCTVLPVALVDLKSRVSQHKAKTEYGAGLGSQVQHVDALVVAGVNVGSERNQDVDCGRIVLENSVV